MQDPTLFIGVAEHLVSFFPQNWVDYSTLQQGTLRLTPREDQYAAWKLDYQTMHEEMFFGETPGFDEILSVVSAFEIRFNRGI